MKLIIIIPALNEETTIAGVIRNIPMEIDGIEKIEILVIDDGSKDRTADIARESGAIVISHSDNKGLGRAMQTGVAEAMKRQADVVVNIDADGQHDPQDIPLLVDLVVKEKADFVIASRFKDPQLIPRMRWIKLIGNHIMSRIVSALAGQRFYDVSSGFRAYSREALQRLVLKGSFTYTHESVLFFAHGDFRIEEVPVSVRGTREFGETEIASNLWRYAFRTMSIIAGYMRDNRSAQLFSYLSVLFFIVSFPTGGFFVWHYMATGMSGSHLWFGIVSAFCFSVAIVFFFFRQFASNNGKTKDEGGSFREMED